MNMENLATAWYFLAKKRGLFMKMLLSLLGSIVMFAGTASAFKLQIGPITQDLKTEHKKNQINDIKKIDIKDLKENSALVNCGPTDCTAIKKND